MEPIEYKSLLIDSESSLLTLTSNMLVYNFNDVTNVVIDDISNNDDTFFDFGYQVKSNSVGHKAFGFENEHFNHVDMVLTTKMNRVTDISGAGDLDKALNKTNHSIVLRGANQNYSQYIVVEIPIHNFDDVSGSFNTSDTNKPGSQIIRKLVYDISNDITELNNGITIDSATLSQINPNDLMSDSNYYSYSYKVVNSELYKCIFIDPKYSPIVLIGTDYDSLEKILPSTSGSTTIYAAETSIESQVAFNSLPMRKTDDVTKTNNLSPEIYIDCSPSNDANSENLIQYMKKPFASDSMKETVDKFIRFIVNILIVFVVVYFLYYKLPGWFDKPPSTNAIPTTASTGSG